MADLAEIFSRLKAQNSSVPPSQSPASAQPSIWAQPQSPNYQPPSVSSPIFSPPIQTPNPPVHSSNIISPVNPSSAVGSPGTEPNRTNNLLNLLKFNTPATQAGPMASLQNIGRTASGTMSDSAQSRSLSAQDLMASLGRSTSASHVLSSSMISTGTGADAEATENSTPSISNSKDFLLNLLTKPKVQSPPPASVVKSTEAETDDAAVDKLSASLAETSMKPTQEEREPTPVRQFGSGSASSTPFEAPQPKKASAFTYVNPFDQLHSSSPLNRSSPSGSQQPDSKKIEILKHDRNASTNAEGDHVPPAAKSRKLTPDPTPQKASPEKPSSAAAEAAKSESVSEALEGVGKKVDKQVEDALAKADAQEHGPPSKATPSKTGDNTADDEAKETNVDDREDIESSWESAEDGEAEEQQDFEVEVYNFPMKPFVSIHIKDMEVPHAIRQDNFMHIAKCKKEFDQIDRNLVTASQTHIVYAQVATKKDTGGIRIVRQDTGDHKQVFRTSGERIFSVQLCNSAFASNDVETVLGTGVNGSVFWTSLAKSRGDLFKDDDIESQGFIMPPVATPEEQTSGSPVKTRAKMSSRHPEYFGMARGKQIYIIAPETVKGEAYCNMKTRKIDTEKYLAEHGLKIMTGKAGKDFCFSEDDTMIVSLDKSGRFKFWDIKDLTRRASDVVEAKHEPVELREPIWSMTAAASGSKPDEKPSVSSIMFLDKERQISKGVALRYMLIGFKQNHILQLWDLGLGKAVQEIRLPHEKDSDGICSVSYYARHAIIAIGHPTRNSIFFIQLSAPGYKLAHMDQAKYINLLARGDPSLPQPDSTAIMSGLREFSFAKVGQLRSLDLLRQPIENASDPDSEDATLFELYVMHSRGVVGIPIKRIDLGWDKENKAVKPVDATMAGIIEVNALVPPESAPPSEPLSKAEVPTSGKGWSRIPGLRKPEPSKSPANADVLSKDFAGLSSAPATNGSAAAQQQQTKPTFDAPDPPPVVPDSYAMAAHRAKSPATDKVVPEPVTAAKKAGSAPQVAGHEDLQSMLNKKFDSLYQRIDSDKRVQEAAGSAKQDALLRLVSSTLTENVEQSLNRVVSESIKQEIVPIATNSTIKTVENKISEMLPQHLNTIVSKEVEATLPHAIQQALKEPQVHNTIANQVAQKVHSQVSPLLQQAMPNIATQATQKVISEFENRTKQQLREAEAHRQQDNAKIHELSNLVQSLSEQVHKLLESQAAFQEQMLKLQRPSAEPGASEGSNRDLVASTASGPIDPQKEAEDAEEARITKMLVDGEYDDATIAWLQSNRQGELFDRIFLRVNPRYLEKVTPLVALSVSAAITASFESHVDQRLEWLASVLTIIDYNDAEIKDVAPKIMDVLSQRLQGAYMNISEQNPSEPALRRISALNRQVMEIRRLAG